MCSANLDKARGQRLSFSFSSVRACIYRRRSVGTRPRLSAQDWPKTPRPHARSSIGIGSCICTHARTHTGNDAMVLLRARPSCPPARPPCSTVPLSCSRRPHHPTKVSEAAEPIKPGRRELHATRASDVWLHALAAKHGTVTDSPRPPATLAWLSAPATTAPYAPPAGG